MVDNIVINYYGIQLFVECIGRINSCSLSFEKWQKTSKRGNRIKKEKKHVADYQALSFFFGLRCE